MKFQITHILCSAITTNVRIIEAKSAISALKQMAGSYMNVGKTKKHFYELGGIVDVYTVGRKGDLPFERDLYIVTEVIEANVPAIMMPIGW